MKYIVKCDDCKVTIKETDDIKESYAGGRCSKCVLLWAVDDYIRTKEYVHSLWEKRHEPGTNYTEHLIKDEFPAYDRLKTASVKAKETT